MKQQFFFKGSILLFLLFFLRPFITTGQDTLLLLNGDLLSGKLTADMGDFYRFDIMKRKGFRSVAVDKADIFSVLEQGKPEKIIYKEDTALGNDFSPSQMRDFWQGEHQARLAYRPVVPMVGGVLVGAAGPALGFWGLALSPLYLGSLATRKPGIGACVPGNIKVKDVEFYKMGYGHSARRIKIQRAALATFGGVVTSWIISVAAGGLK